jgi:hypothetical protein
MPNQYILPTTCNPPGTLTGLVFGQVLQIFQLCSRDQDIDLELAAFYHHLLDRGYKGTSPPTSIMSEDANAQQNSFKQSRHSSKEGGSSAAVTSGGCATTQARSTKQAGDSMPPLAAALVLKDKFIKLLHKMLQHFYSQSPQLC